MNFSDTIISQNFIDDKRIKLGFLSNEIYSVIPKNF